MDMDMDVDVVWAGGTAADVQGWIKVSLGQFGHPWRYPGASAARRFLCAVASINGAQCPARSLPCARRSLAGCALLGVPTVSCPVPSSDYSCIREIAIGNSMGYSLYMNYCINYSHEPVQLYSSCVVVGIRLVVRVSWYTAIFTKG